MAVGGIISNKKTIHIASGDLILHIGSGYDVQAWISETRGHCYETRTDGGSAVIVALARHGPLTEPDGMRGIPHPDLLGERAGIATMTDPE
jgi:hypothetical protein